MVSKINRYDRRSGRSGSGDSRSAAQRDRDRLLYTSAFQRLAEVTQVISPGEGHVFHNRLTHSLKVAQVARRLAEKLLSQQPTDADALGGIDPDVVEAAALAHDIGHPPFGHIAEEMLEKLVTDAGEKDGFEGNAQSFRIVTKLAVRPQDAILGLDLTRATLNALLKYPWLKGRGPKKNKWGAYTSEQPEFLWARELAAAGDCRKSAEAELMDWADDVTYAVHDASDFYCAGLMPLDRLASRDDSERKRFFDEVFHRLGADLEFRRWELEEAFTKLVAWMPFDQKFVGTKKQRAKVHTMSGFFIDRYVGSVALRVPNNSSETTILIDIEHQKEVFMLKQLTWHYVILNPALGAQQFGRLPGTSLKVSDSKPS
jgi:dGTPase